MKCSSLESLIALYVEGDLPLSDRRRVETHLQGCTACSALAEDLRESQSMFKSLRVGTVNSSELMDVRERVLNEVGDLEPAPGWVVAMHRLFFAGLRRRNAIAGVLLAALVSGSVWYSQTRVNHEGHEGRNEAPIEVARLNVLALPDLVPRTPKAPRIVTRLELTETLVEATPEISAAPVVVESLPQESQALHVPMKFVTDDPDVIIYWLPADKGD